jgi:hypothetical protein
MEAVEPLAAARRWESPITESDARRWRLPDGPGELAKITFFIIAFELADLHVESGHPGHNEDPI